MIFRVGTKEDVDGMLSSDSPDGSFLFRPTEDAPDCLTLCVKKGASLKKYRITEVKEGTGTTYMWNNKNVQGADGSEEKFPTLNNLVQRKRRVFHLKKDFLDGQNLVEEMSPSDVERKRAAVEEQQHTVAEIYGDEEDTYGADGSDEESFVQVGTIEDEERMKKSPPSAGTFLVRPSEGGGLTVCVLNKNKVGKLVVRKHHIRTAVGDDNNDISYSLVNKKSDESVIASEEAFPSLEAFIRCKWRHFSLQRNFLGDKSFDDMFGGGQGGQHRGIRKQQEVAMPEVLSSKGVCIRFP